MEKVKDLIIKQLSYEFDVSPKDLLKKDNIFSHKKHDDNFFYNNKTKASIVCYNNILLVRSENEDLLKELKDKYENYPGQWFLEAKNIYELSSILGKYGLKIKNIFPLYGPQYIDEKVNHDDFVWLKDEDFDFYKKDKTYDFVFSYEDGELGLAYKDGDKLVALLGASPEANYFYDLGLEKYIFDPKYRGAGVKLLKYFTYESLKDNEGRIPLCSTQFSHTKSINLMTNAGYRHILTNISLD